MVLNILSACKAEERGVAIATASDDNAADGKTGSASCLKYQPDTTLAQTVCFSVHKDEPPIVLRILSGVRPFCSDEQFITFCLTTL